MVAVETLGSSYPHNLGLDVSASALNNLRAVDHSADQSLGEIGLEKRNVTDVVKESYLFLKKKMRLCMRERGRDRRRKRDLRITFKVKT